MGPNGSGKSTLAYVLAGREDYEVTDGDIRWNGESLLEMEPDERAAKGVFLAFQYPMEIPGVAGLTFLRTAAQRRAQEARPGGAVDARVPEARARRRRRELNIDMEMLKRPVNVGFSGGEKKRSEILQMAVLEPTLCVLDETDSGLDIDALRIVADGVNAMRAKDRAMLVITHYQRLLELHRARQGACHGRWAHRRNRAARSWRSSSRPRATPNTRGRPREHQGDTADRRGNAGSYESGAAGRRARARKRGAGEARDERSGVED